MRSFKKRVLSFLSEASNPTSLYINMKQIAVKDTAQYAYEYFERAVFLYSRDYLLEFAVNRILDNSSQTDSVFLEFGVWKGESINKIAALAPRISVIGFDSFLGLEEDWTGMPQVLRGTFNLDGIPPKVRENVSLIIGSYEQTLESYLEAKPNLKVGLVHLDSDTYTPTAFVLDKIHSYLKKGTLIIFDEYMGFPNWRNHEFKAWQECVRANNISYDYIAFTGEQVLIEIK